MIKCCTARRYYKDIDNLLWKTSLIKEGQCFCCHTNRYTYKQKFPLYVICRQMIYDCMVWLPPQCTSIIAYPKVSNSTETCQELNGWMEFSVVAMKQQWRQISIYHLHCMSNNKLTPDHQTPSHYTTLASCPLAAIQNSTIVERLALGICAPSGWGAFVRSGTWHVERGCLGCCCFSNSPQQCPLWLWSELCASQCA